MCTFENGTGRHVSQVAEIASPMTNLAFGQDNSVPLAGQRAQCVPGWLPMSPPSPMHAHTNSHLAQLQPCVDLTVDDDDEHDLTPRQVLVPHYGMMPACWT
jgi:hypothetical protein